LRSVPKYLVCKPERIVIHRAGWRYTNVPQIKSSRIILHGCKWSCIQDLEHGGAVFESIKAVCCKCIVLK
jgi:hypothetical protein